MSSAKITLIGFSDYMQDIGNDLFNKMNLPPGIDKDVLEGNILLRGGEFEVLYSNPYFMQEAIGIWTKKWYRTMEKWVAALAIDYNPLENYDRMEEWQDDTNSEVIDHSEGTGHTGTENKVSAFNSDNYEPDSAASADTTNSTDGKTTSTIGNKKQGRTHGNIGVTTSQQMLQSELDIAKWNLYEHITDLFLQEFVIPIY